MSKRYAEDGGEGDQAYLKRQKISFSSNEVTIPPNPSIELEIRSARKLRQVLAFDQDVTQSKKAIQSFKTFLESIASTDDNSAQLSILKEYLEAQKPAEDDESATYLGDLIRTWGLASELNHDSLLSALPAIFALLLKTISNSLDLTEYGLRIGRMLLLKPQQELISRCLTASKTKEFIISPALRLLREIITFDVGTMAKQVFRARDETFKSLARNLRLKYTGDEVEDRRKPSVRTNALRLVLSSLKFLPMEAKRDLLNQREVVAALTRDLKDDPPFMVREILDILKTCVLQDDTLPRDAKTKIVNANSLGRISMLYRYHQFDEEISTDRTLKSVATVAHDFMLLACTSPDIGILNRQAGYYPRGINPDEMPDFGADHTVIDLGLDGIEWMDQFTENVPVRNTILSDFLQDLKPWSSLKQSELILAVLRAAPELVASYFICKKDFSFEPKLTATWIGYSAFIFTSLQLPIPKYFGHQQKYARLPPPTSILLENLLPRALTQKVLTRCLSHANNMITFFVVRLLCVALAKLKNMIRMHHEADTGSSSNWAKAAEKLTAEFCQRCPSIKDVISAFRNMPNTEMMQREATTKLLVLYYEVIPRVALDVKYDVSSTLSEVLLTMDESSKIPQDRIIRSIELENLFQFAHFSPGMRWFTKAGELTISPFMAMLKLSAEAPANFPLLRIRFVLKSVISETQILQSHTSLSALRLFILRLRDLRGSESGQVWEYVDDCVARCASKPIKYIFMLEEFQAEAHESDDEESCVSLVTLVLVEQWPFLAKKVSAEVLEEAAKFLASHIAGSIRIGEDKKVLKLVLKKLSFSTEDKFIQNIFDGARELEVSVPDMEAAPILEPLPVAETSVPSESEKSKVVETYMEDSEARAEDHSALTRWTNKDVDEVIEAGHAAALVRLLSSEHLSVRKEATTNLSKFSAKLKESMFEEKEQIWLLLAEVVETAKKVVDNGPLPNLISAFASSAITVLNDPLHCLYPKINKFLSQGPTWELDKVPLMYKILDEAPSLDDAHYLETAWLLNYMLAGLQTSADMSIFRKRRIFEKLLSLYNNTYLASGLRDKILRILYKASAIEGASTTLITRSSIMTWLQAQIALGGGLPLKVLLERIYDSCDQKRVGVWSKDGAQSIKSEAMKM
ncbi:ribosome 60S biogenesis N-terminal-domain-containing protein [Calycina marina]|uniref:Ribosome 60S biogenesis N-terminal-domain-containing protein n=1 Tax=Calycina marina TaxID=1763456 RepID=A0A9P7YYD2_9HELO|nr:ribosome 60S biogenesis N-terminal-domain-containing protein [Calycina marina]